MRLKFLLAMLLIASPCFGTTYYIDYVGGSDANVGSKAFPWKLAPGMPGFSATYAHVAGDQFIFKGGVTWPKVALPWTIGYSGTAGNVDAYGGLDHTWYTGGGWSQPILDGQQLSGTAGTIIRDNGALRSYILINDLTVRNVGNAVTGTNTGGTGSNAVLTDSTKTWTTNQFYHYWLYDTTDGSRCYIVSNTATTVTCNPTLIGGTNNFWTSGDAYTITNGSGSAISLMGGGSNIEVSNNTIKPNAIEAFSYANSYLGAGVNSAHILFHNNDVTLGGRFVIYGYTGKIVDDVQVYSNTIGGQGTALTAGYHLDGLMIGNPSITECSAALTPTVTHISFHDNTFYGARPGGGTALYFSNACTNYTNIYNNIFQIERVESSYVGYGIRFQDFDGNINIFNNTFSSDANAGYDKGFTGAIQTGSSYQPMYGALAIKNNIFSGFGIDISGEYGQFSSTDIDYNLHNLYSAGHKNIVFYLGTPPGQCTTMACVHALGWETHGLLGAPLFTTVPNGTLGSGNLHLLLGSPAIGSGVNLYSTFTTDLAGNARPASGAWDMGVYINGSAPTPALVNVAPGAISFLSQLVGFVSPSNVINLFNPTTTTLNIASIVASGAGFSIASTTCGSTLVGGAGCTITTAWTAQMKASAAAPVIGYVTITSDAPSSPDVVTLSGSAGAVIMTGGKIS